MATCTVCGDNFDAVRPHAKFCSPKCRKAGSRSVTDDVTLPEPPVTVNGSIRDTGLDDLVTLPVLKPLTSGNANGVSEITGVIPPGLHVHDLHPHRHLVIEDGPFKGRRKKCSGRWWCRSCGRWTDGKLCHSDLG